MGRIVHIKQDGFTTCVIDVDGNAHCFRIDKAIGAELCAMYDDLMNARRAGQLCVNAMCKDCADRLQGVLNSEVPKLSS